MSPESMSRAYLREGDTTETAGSATDAQAPQGGPLGSVAIEAMQTALAAEHGALWAYGLVAAYDPAAATTVTTMVTSHQSIRDTAANLIVQGGATPVGPQPAYTSPKPVTDKASALILALTIESDCADAWRAVIGSTEDSTLRGTALSALTDSAMRMVTWRQAAGNPVLTIPFPGAAQLR
ncbi:MAG: ferritin-like domain-containing protein [Nakamurella sp.]